MQIAFYIREVRIERFQKVLRMKKASVGYRKGVLAVKNGTSYVSDPGFVCTVKNPVLIVFENEIPVQYIRNELSMFDLLDHRY